MQSIPLTVFERLVLLNLLPHEGEFTTLKLMRELRESLSFDEAEHAALQFQQEGTQVRWNINAEHNKAIAVGEKQHDIIAEILKDLNKQKKLRDEQYTLYEKFARQTE